MGYRVTCWGDHGDFTPVFSSEIYDTYEEAFTHLTRHNVAEYTDHNAEIEEIAESPWGQDVPESENPGMWTDQP